MSLEDIQYEVISSIMEYAGLVDANALLFIWPIELRPYRICIISGAEHAPMFSCFSGGTGARQDVIMRCSGSHFTLLQPLGDSGGGGTVVSKL